MKQKTYKIEMVISPKLEAALQELGEYRKCSKAKPLLDSLVDIANELVRIDFKSLPAFGAIEIHLTASPSDFLLKLLAAFRTLDRNVNISKSIHC